VLGRLNDPSTGSWSICHMPPMARSRLLWQKDCLSLCPATFAQHLLFFPPACPSRGAGVGLGRVQVLIGMRKLGDGDSPRFSRAEINFSRLSPPSTLPSLKVHRVFYMHVGGLLRTRGRRGYSPWPFFLYESSSPLLLLFPSPAITRNSSFLGVKGPSITAE